MAIYHLCIKLISRGKGKNAVAEAYYRSGEKINNEYDRIVNDFTRKGGISHTEILLPQNTPQEFPDRGKQISPVREYVKDNFVNVGMCADIALHDKGGGNPHCHTYYHR